MVHLLSAIAHTAPLPVPPQRRRIVVIGAGAAGLSAAFLLGEHCLLLERRQILEDSNDHPRNLPLGTERGRALGAQDRGADGQRPGLSVEERKSLCNAIANASPLIRIERWEPPDLSSHRRAAAHDEPGRDEREGRAGQLALRALIPLLRGELRFGATVVRICPSQRLVELADGARFIYDKLLSTVPFAALTAMVLGDLPRHIRCDETLRYWLNARDIEIADSDTRIVYGDMDEFAAGKRVADLIKRALAEKFGSAGASNAFGKRLFEPRLVMR